MKIKKCIVCGKEFLPVKSAQKCCSEQCSEERKKHNHKIKYDRYEETNRYKEKKLCECCGKEYFGKKTSKYCSKNCTRASVKFDMVCVICGKHFKSGNSEGKYCSKECKAIFKKENPKHILKCDYCGKEFGTNDKNQKYCSRSCVSSDTSFKYNSGLRKEREKELIEFLKINFPTLELKSEYKNSKSEVKIYCNECKREFEIKPDNIKHGNFGGCIYHYTITCKRCGCKYNAKTYQTTYCNECKKLIDEELKIKNIELSKLKAVATLKRNTKTCEHCGVEFIRKSKDKLCYKCREEYKEKEKRAKEEELLKIDRKCENCGEIFHSIKDKKYCTPKCARRMQSSRKEVLRRQRIQENGDVDYSITLDKLIKRDKCTCKICGKKCDLKDYYIDDKGNFIAGELYPSIDHMIPVSKGGQHNWNNIQLAHRKCNTQKNNNLIIEDKGQFRFF